MDFIYRFWMNRLSEKIENLKGTDADTTGLQAEVDILKRALKGPGRLNPQQWFLS